MPKTDYEIERKMREKKNKKPEEKKDAPSMLGKVMKEQRKHYPEELTDKEKKIIRAMERGDEMFIDKETGQKISLPASALEAPDFMIDLLVSGGLAGVGEKLTRKAAKALAAKLAKKTPRRAPRKRATRIAGRENYPTRRVPAKYGPPKKVGPGGRGKKQQEALRKQYEGVKPLDKRRYGGEFLEAAVKHNEALNEITNILRRELLSEGDFDRVLELGREIESARRALGTAGLRAPISNRPNRLRKRMPRRGRPQEDPDYTPPPPLDPRRR